MLDQITPVILSFNEEANLRRTLDALSWAKRVIVMDSFSTDDTESICKQYPNIDFVQRKFDEHAIQWNAALKQNITSPWTLALDADHVLSDELRDELSTLKATSSTQGFWVSFIYKINGKPVAGSLYPALISLYRTGTGHYTQDGHTQRLVINGEIGELRNKIYHDDRKSWSRWLSSQKQYALKEADKLASEPFSNLAIQDKLRAVGLAPLLVIPYTLLYKGTIGSGLPGLLYVWQRFVAECFLQLARLQKVKG